MKGTEMKESFSNVTVAKKKIHVSDCFNDSYMDLSVPRAGLEPARPQWSQDFKSCVSTSSTTRAKWA